MLGKALNVSFQSVEQGVIDKLKPAVLPLPTDPFPDNAANYHKHQMKSHVGAVLVSMTNFAAVGQGESKSGFSFGPRIHILTPGLQATEQHRGAFSVIEAAIDALHERVLKLPDRTDPGNTPDHLYKIFVLRGRFVVYHDGLWEFVMETRIEPKMKRQFL